MSPFAFSMTLAASLGTGLVAGVFFGFSSFVMRALSKLPPSQGIAAMQSINVVVINPVFMLAFLGTGVLCLGVGAWSMLNWSGLGSRWLLTGVLLYLIGTIGVTMALNVPRNNVLAKIDPIADDSVVIWEKYVSEWTLANHLRTAAAIGASGCFILGLVKGA